MNRVRTSLSDQERAIFDEWCARRGQKGETLLRELILADAARVGIPQARMPDRQMALDLSASEAA